MSYRHLTAYERGQIQALWAQGKSKSAIAQALNRHPTTIGRELQRNQGPQGYVGERAQQRYRERRKECRAARKLDHPPLWNYIVEKLAWHWSPATIAGRLRLEYPDDPQMRISHEALYQALYRDERLSPMIAYLRQARRRRRPRGQGKVRRALIPDRVSIRERPAVVEERSRFGDWEADLVLGKNQHGAVVSVVGRKSRLLLARKVQSKQSHEVMTAILGLLEDLPARWVRTVTFDNGTEFYHHQRLTEELGLATFFADPYAAYQRGTNENTNGLLRQYLPKTMSFEDLSQQSLDVIVDELNHRPRKILGYRTPYEVFRSDTNRPAIALSA